MTINNIVENSIEDLADDYTSTVFFKTTKAYFDPLKKPFEGDNPSDWDNAVSGAISTLQMGITLVAVNYVVNTLLPNMAVRGLAIYSYIMGGKVAQSVRNRLASRLNNIKKGRTASKILGLFTDGPGERAQRAKIANDLVSHMETMQLRKEKVANDTRIALDANMSELSAKGKQDALLLYANKTKTGTWTTSLEDRKLYERAVGSSLKKGLSWSKLVDKLNSFQEFAKSSENEVLNLAQVQLDTFTSNGIERI